MRRIKTIARRTQPTIRSAPAASVLIAGLDAMKKALLAIHAEAPHLTFGELTIQVGPTSPTVSSEGASPAVEAKAEESSPPQAAGFLSWRNLVDVFLDAQDEAGVEVLKRYIATAERVGARFALKRIDSRENAFLTWRDGQFEVEVVADLDDRQGSHP